ncbi:MAG: hypothetical protein CR982_04640 [Candidatus Cloacimonadota bacterium]|nr:MAG: hypothetical protein CR982_04640 [Candidatus Cloacimonadota bacterium]PIE77968.1 MAG: hypothetical protein CSA15_10205 [Candidatus Delongbacteria bacterium]
MLKSIKVDNTIIEMMLFYWQSSLDKEKVSEQYLNEISQSKQMGYTYDNEFNGESVRKVLSAITNREPFKSNIKKESRFWNNNMWVMEDMELTNFMVDPIKKLNLDSFIPTVENSKFEEIELIFVPGTLETSYVKENKIVVNFFKIAVDYMDPEKITIENTPFIEYIENLIKSSIA